MTEKTRAFTYLLTGTPGAARAENIDAVLRTLPPGEKITLILEGAPANGTQESKSQPDMSIHVLAPGCLCCIGNLALRVTLARVLRLEQPKYLLLAIIDIQHQQSLRHMLSQHPYGDWLSLQDAV